MARRPMDLSLPSLELPDLGWRRGWEPAALMALTLMLLGFGLVNLYSASSFLATRQGLPDWYFVVRQASGSALGLVGLVICARLPYHSWEKAAWPLVWISTFLLVLVILPGTEAIAPEINGARRWLRIGITVQPSEFAKVAVVVWTATMAVRKVESGQFKSLSKGLLPFLVVWGMILVPVALGPNLSTACLIAALGVLTVYAAGARIGHFIFLGLLVAPLLKAQLEVGFRVQRLLAFLDPGTDASGAGFQVTQSMIAVGSGGLTGQGFGEGQQKFGFLPEPHNDFIFAMIGEEWGLIGVIVLVTLYLGIVLVGYRIARRAPDLFGQLLAIGVTNLIALQSTLHIAVGLGLVPTTGVALPLVSWGRSNLIVTLACLGILMAVARETDEDWREDVRARGRVDDLAHAERLRWSPEGARG